MATIEFVLPALMTRFVKIKITVHYYVLVLVRLVSYISKASPFYCFEVVLLYRSE
jgi:hypothetical protein